MVESVVWLVDLPWLRLARAARTPTRWRPWRRRQTTTGSRCAGRCPNRRRPVAVPGRRARRPPTSRRLLGRWRRRPRCTWCYRRPGAPAAGRPRCRGRDPFDDHHLGAAVQVDGDLRVGGQVGPGQRAGAKPEAVRQPYPPHRSAVRAAVRAGGGDPVGASRLQPLLGPRPRQQLAGRGRGAEHHRRRGGRGGECVHVRPPARWSASLISLPRPDLLGRWPRVSVVDLG